MRLAFWLHGIGRRCRTSRTSTARKTERLEVRALLSGVANPLSLDSPVTQFEISPGLIIQRQSELRSGLGSNLISVPGSGGTTAGPNRPPLEAQIDGSFDIVLHKGSGLLSNPAADAAFERAAVLWESVFADPVTVNLDVDLAASPIGGGGTFGPTTLGATASVAVGLPYSDVRARLIADASADESIVDQLPAVENLSFDVRSGFLTVGVTSAGLQAGNPTNTLVSVNRANALALGFTNLGGTVSAFTGGVIRDAAITFNVALPFDFDNSNGTTAGTSDFEGVAIHEIGHALGFSSGVDIVDQFLSGNVLPETIDLFRLAPGQGGSFSTADRILNLGTAFPTQVFHDGQFDVSPFSAAPGVSGLMTGDIPFATGAVNGDGNQASHFKADDITGINIGIMDPTQTTGTVSEVREPDLRVLGLVGWDRHDSALFGSVPTVTVDVLTTMDTTPALTGTVSESTASVLVNVPDVHGTDSVTITVDGSPEDTSAFTITSTGAANIVRAELTLRNELATTSGTFPSGTLVFDTVDAMSQDFEASAAEIAVVGLTSPESDANNDEDVRVLTKVLSLDFSDFDPGESFSWRIDVDSLAGISFGEITGESLAGSLFEVELDNGLVLQGTLDAVGAGNPDAAAVTLTTPHYEQAMVSGTTWTLPDNTLLPLAGGTHDVEALVIDSSGATATDPTSGELMIGDLMLTIVADSISEGDGAAATTATVMRSGDTSSAVTVSLSSSDETEVTVPASVTILAGQSSATFNLDAIDDAIVDGTQTVTITATAVGHAEATDSIDVTDDETPQLTLAIVAASFSESAGAAATTATVTRNTDTTGALTVTLSSSDTTEATVPATVVIPAGQPSVSFDIDAVDDTTVDGTQTVTVTATATGLANGIDTVDVLDDDSPTLTLAIVAGSVSETAGASATMATVTRNTDTAGALTVTLSSDDTSEATVPAMVVIAAGQISATFSIDAVDDAVADGTQTVTISAAAAGFAGGSDTLDVTDDESAALTVTIAAASVSEATGAAATTVTITRNSGTAGALTVTLSSSDETEATVPASVDIPDGQTEVTVNLAAVDDGLVDGTQTVTITAMASGHTAGTDTVDVTDDDVSSLTLVIAAASISEAAGAGATTATVSRNSDTTGSLVVTLASDDTGEASVPASVTILAGQAEVTFDIDAVDDALIDGTQVVAISATASGHLGATDTVSVFDDDGGSLPTLDQIPDFTLPGGFTATHTLTGITSGIGATEPVRLTAVATDPTLVTAIDISPSEPTGSTADLKFTTVAQSTTATSMVTVTIEDAGPDLDFNTAGDNSFLTRSFNVTVTPENSIDLSQLSAANSAARIELQRSADRLTIEVDDVPLGDFDFAALSTLLIVGNDADNRLVVDFSNGDPIPSGGLTFLGGGQTTGDTLELTGGTAADIVHTFLDPASGTVAVDASMIMYDELEPIIDQLIATNRQFIFGATADVITLGDDGVASNGLSRISSVNSSETVDFAAPTRDLRIDGGAFSVIAIGGGGNDSLTGGDARDILLGGSGMDLLIGGGGDDVLLGQGGSNDSLSGGAGNDILNGGRGTDVVMETADTDFTLTNSGLLGVGIDLLRDIEQAVLTGGASANRLDAGAFFFGGVCSVTLNGGGGDDTMIGSPCNDVLLGGSGDDNMFGGAGNDFMGGQGGRDTMFGQAGNDKVNGQGSSGDQISGGPGNDRLFGGPGTDRLFETIDGDYTLFATVMNGAAGKDRLFELEIVRLNTGPAASRIDLSGFSLAYSVITTGGGNDEVIGSPGPDFVFGGDGDDTLRGLGGNDQLLGEAGDNSLLGGAGNNSLSGGSEDDILNGGSGDDTLDGGSGADGLSGHSGNDLLIGGSSSDTLFGGDGNDLLLGGAGDDTAFGGSASDEVNGGQGTDKLVGGNGNGNDPGDSFVGLATEIDALFRLNTVPDWVDRV